MRVSVDGSDIQALERRIETRFQAAQAKRSARNGVTRATGCCCRWRFLGCSGSGAARRWRGRDLLVAACTSRRPNAQAKPRRFADLWLTPDQQGRIAFDRGDYAGAAKLFRRSDVAGHRRLSRLRFPDAAQEFRKVETIEGRFALGNAEAQNHAWEKAIKAYDEVLKAQPDHAAAKTNRAIVAAPLKAQEEKRRKQEQDDSAPPDEKADETRVDPKAEGRQAHSSQAAGRDHGRRRRSLDARGPDHAGGFPEAEVRHPGGHAPPARGPQP